MPPPVRERYNAKARRSTLGGSSHKNRSKGKGKADQRAASDAEDDVEMDDGEEFVPEMQSRADILRKSLFPDEQAMSSKKRKRLDSYITKKLKQESRLESLSLLAQHALPTSSSSNMLSTATLGQNPSKPLTATQRVARKEDIGVRRAMDRQAQKGVGMFDGDEFDGDDAEEELGMGSAKFRAEREETKLARNGTVVAVVSDPHGMLEAGGEPGPSKKLKGKGAGKQASWGNLLSTQPQELSSDFDSSDSEEDVPEDKAAASTSAVIPSPDAAKIEQEATTSTTVTQHAATASASVAKSMGSSLGSSLKRRADGEALPPTVIKRIEKPKDARMTVRDRKRLRERQAMLDAIAAEEQESDDEDEEDDDDDEEDEESDVSGVEEYASSEEKEEEEDEDEEDEDEDDERSQEGSDDAGSEDEEIEESAEAQAEDGAPPAKRRKAANFKAWAAQQIGASTAPDLLAMNKPASASSSTPSANPVKHMGPLGASYNIPSTSLLSRKAPASTSSVPADNLIAQTMAPRPKLQRRPSVDEQRSHLPVVSEEQPLMEAILLHPVVIVCGETGSGKTTQVPQMLYEAGFGFPGSENPGMIAVTQPRRVAAVSLSIRVADELNLPKKSAIVAHQIRYSSTTSPETAIKFMTDGVLLRELAYDFLLKRYSVIVVDEAHERGVNTDVLVGVLSRVAKLRERMWRDNKDGVRPLRIIIMSATLRVSDFVENKILFDRPPPVINISARQHPVTVHFNRRTVGDYVTEAYKKVAKIHARLPPGGVLVFMTGQAEIATLCRKLDKKFGPEALAAKKAASLTAQQTVSQREQAARDWEKGEDAKVLPGKGAKKNMTDGVLEIEDMDIGLTEDLAGDVDDGDVAEEDPEALDSDDEDDVELGIDKEQSDMPVHVLPLYSLLSNEQQLRVFKPPPEGHRLIVVATNVAETSLTIPNVKYVVDAGRAKERQYHPASGVQTFAVSWVSKASASQRAGRAGRTGPGHCYRLYSSNLFENHFQSFSLPEILRMPIEGIVLQMKSMNIDAVANFPFPTPPDRQGLKSAETLLTHLGALEPPKSAAMVNGSEVKNTIGGKITDLGKAMAAFPVTPRFAKMLVIGQQHGCLPYVIAIVAALSVGDPFMREEALGLMKGEDEEAEGEGAEDIEQVAEYGTIRSDDLRRKEERKAKRRAYYKSQAQFAALGDGASDLFKILAVTGAYSYATGEDAFCAKSFVRAKAMKEIQQLSTQITSIANATLSNCNLPANPKLSPPNSTQLKVIRQILCAGFIDQIAVRKDLVSKADASDKAMSIGAAARAGTKGKVFDTTKGIAYRAVGVNEDVFIHPSSVISGGSPPDWIVFGEVVRTSKVWLRTITKINPSWIATLGKSLCTFSRPLEMPSDAVKSKARSAAAVAGGSTTDPNTRDAFVTPHYGDLMADLPVIKVVQRRVGGGRWITEI